jgi:hypothetical protein
MKKPQTDRQGESESTGSLMDKPNVNSSSGLQIEGIIQTTSAYITVTMYKYMFSKSLYAK